MIFVDCGHGTDLAANDRSREKRRRGGFLRRDHDQYLQTRSATCSRRNMASTVKHWRGDATEIVNRVARRSARRTGRPSTSRWATKRSCRRWTRKAILGVFDPPAAKGYPKQFRRSGPEHDRLAGVALRHQLQSSARQSRRSAEDLRRSAAPKWKGKFGLANPGIHVTTLQFVLSLEKLYGPKWLKDRRRLGEAGAAHRRAVWRIRFSR